MDAQALGHIASAVVVESAIAEKVHATLACVRVDFVPGAAAHTARPRRAIATTALFARRQDVSGDAWSRKASLESRFTYPGSSAAIDRALSPGEGPVHNQRLCGANANPVRSAKVEGARRVRDPEGATN